MKKWNYMIKKVLVFVLLYCISAVIGEGVVIGILFGMGYDPLHGVLPTGQFGALLPYYGFLFFSLVTVFYCRFVEKRTLKSIGFSANVADYLLGALLAVVCLTAIMGLGCLCGSMELLGVNTKVEVPYTFLWLLAFAIQGAAEEIMCRGFLLGSLKKETSVPMAIFVSSTAFAAPHFPSLWESDWSYAIVGTLNLYLISVLFSVLALRRSGIWAACGLHSVWNFVLYWVMGLTLSGNSSSFQGILLFREKNADLWNGAEYGIEAGFLTTVVLGITLLVLEIRQRRKGENGVS